MKKVTFIYKTSVFFDFFLIFDEFSNILLLQCLSVFARTTEKYSRKTVRIGKCRSKMLSLQHNI